MTKREGTLVGQMAGFCEVKGTAERCECACLRSRVCQRSTSEAISLAYILLKQGLFVGLELCPYVFPFPAQGVRAYYNTETFLNAGSS